MTPDQARRLLDGTTPGPWEVDHDHAWAPGVWSPGSIVFGPYYDREDMEQWEAGSDADLRLAAAAPALAAMLAGMREEWGVSCGGEKPGAWWASREEADQCAKRMSICIHYPLPIVVVRRYVTTPEEA